MSVSDSGREESSMDTQQETPDAVDIPVTVPPEVAEDMADDLEQQGYIDLRIKKADAPNIVEQIRWQLENGKAALRFVEDYDE